MKINVKTLMALCLTLINPLIGLIASLISIKAGRKNVFVYCLISLFFVALFIKVPPMYDLNIRYWEIMSIKDNFFNIFISFQDFLLYIVSFYILDFGLPFYIIPSFFMGMMVYCYLRSINEFCFKYNNLIVSDKKFIFIIFLSILFINYINVGIGIRFGSAMFLFIYGLINNLNKYHKKSYILFVLAVTMHFSMVIPVIALVFSKLVKIKKWYAISIAIIIMLFSEFIGLDFIKNINIFGVGEHSVIYIDGTWSQTADNINSRIPEIINRIFFIILFLFMFLSKDKFSTFDNYCYTLLILTSMFYSSHTIFGRYLAVLLHLIMIRQLYALLVNRENYYFKDIGKSLKYFILIFVLYTFLISNIFLNRRVYQLGEMWEVLYIPIQIQIIKHSQSDFENYFQYLDQDGYWIQSGQQKTK